jgi:hypothetical protein
MPTTIYDSSLITQRARDKTIANSFISRIQNPINSNTGSSPLLGITAQSIINTVRNGQMAEFRKNEGGCTIIDTGCPCITQVIPQIIPPRIYTDDFYVVGGFTSTGFTIYSSTGEAFIGTPSKPIGDSDAVYIVKYDKNGIPIWATKIVGSIPSTITFLDYPVIAVDTDGSIYLSGLTNKSSINFFNTGSAIANFTLTMSGAVGVFRIWISKYTIDGIFEWATYIINQNPNAPFPNIAIDTNHNLYIATYYSSTVTFYETNNLSSVNSFVSLGDWDNFLVKYDSNGKYIWVTNIGGTIRDYIPSIKCDNSDNVFISGFYDSNPLFIYNANYPSSGSAAFSLTTDGGSDNYLVKYDKNGIAQWATHIGGASYEQRANISIDSIGNLYISAFYDSNPLNIYNKNSITPAFILNKDGLTDIYLVKYSTEGIAQWATYMGGTDEEIQPYISIDNLDNIIVSGVSRSNSIDIYNATSTLTTPPTLSKTITFPSLSNTYIFLVKFNSSGISLWGTYIGPFPPDSSLNIQPRPAVTCDSLGNIYIVAIYFPGILKLYDTSYVQTISITNSSSGADKRNTFLAKYNNSGTPLWVTQNTYAILPNIATAFKPYQ